VGIKDFVVVAGTEGFTDIKTGEVHDLAEMLTSFTVADLIEVRLVSRLVRPLLQRSRARNERPKEFRPGWGFETACFCPLQLGVDAHFVIICAKLRRIVHRQRCYQLSPRGNNCRL
jgi:hypothetical protein